MSVEKGDQIAPERYRATAAFLISVPIYVAAVTGAWIAFGFWQMAVLVVLFLVVKGNRSVSALMAHWVRNLPAQQPEAESLRRGPKKSRRPKTELVIDHDPNEFRRSYR